jgi:hypothetical protein
MIDPEARADAACLLKKFEKLLREIIAANPNADEAQLERLFVAAVERDPVLGAVAMQEGFWHTVDAIRREEER